MYIKCIFAGLTLEEYIYQVIALYMFRYMICKNEKSQCHFSSQLLHVFFNI